MQKVAASGSYVSTLPSILVNATPNFTSFDPVSQSWVDSQLLGKILYHYRGVFDF